MRKALLALAVLAVAAACIASAFFMIADHAAASVDFEDASWGGGYAERVGGFWRLAVPLRGQEASAVLRSRQEFRGGYFEVEMKTVSSRVVGSAFYLYAGKEPDDFEEVDVEVYGFMENVSDVYANLNPATADFTCWVNGQRHMVRTRLGFLACEGFHTYGVKWVPGEAVEFYVDGVKVAAFYGERVPKRPMRLYLQTWYAGWMSEFGTPEGEAVTLFRNVSVHP